VLGCVKLSRKKLEMKFRSKSLMQLDCDSPQQHCAVQSKYKDCGIKLADTWFWSCVSPRDSRFPHRPFPLDPSPSIHIHDNVTERETEREREKGLFLAKFCSSWKLGGNAGKRWDWLVFPSLVENAPAVLDIKIWHYSREGLVLWWY
jgi:hypothetical protein